LFGNLNVEVSGNIVNHKMTGTVSSREFLAGNFPPLSGISSLPRLITAGLMVVNGG
jgi:hypothetical protein